MGRLAAITFDPPAGEPGTKFRVIGAGMSRTGTKSLGDALAALGIGPVHDSGIYLSRGSRRQQEQWLEVAALAARETKTLTEAKRLEYLLASLLEGYSATMDVPACLLTPELLSLYPDAVVVVTTRDPESWFHSEALIDGLNDWWTAWPMRLMLAAVPRLHVLPRWVELRGQMMRSRVGKPAFTGPEDLVAHEDWLRRIVPPEKLCFYDVRDGWGPLCRFLGVAEPDLPFPHSNAAVSVRKDFAAVLVAGVVSWSAVIGVGASATWYALRIWRRWSASP